MSSPRLENFKRDILRGQAMPDDLLRLWTLYESHPSDRLARLGARLIEPGNIPALLNHSYLNDEDRANADIVRNIGAFDEVFDLATFVVELEDTSILGYWHGPEQVPISGAPILVLDTEGQFELVPGRTLVESLVGHVLQYSDADEIDDTLNWLSTNGISLGVQRLEDPAEPRVGALPREIHLRAYNRRRIADGLPAI